MRNKLLFIILLGLSAVFSQINAQQLTIRIEKPFVAKSLSGIIVDANGGKIPFATVTRFTAGWKNEIESVETDDKGKFNFKRLPSGTYYLRISASGFGKLEVEVRLKSNSKTKLKFKLEIAS